MNIVDSNLAEAIAKATIYWIDCREKLANIMKPEWDKSEITAHMMSNYIMVDTPITIRISSLDNKNKAILFRALLKWYGDFPVEIIHY